MRIPAILAGLAALTAAASTVQAADLGTSQSWDAPSSGFAAPATASWAGLYAGAHIGAGWGDASAANTSGFLGGGHLGYNFQFGQIVAGVEGDIDASGIDHSGFSDKFNQSWLGSARARLGYSFDRFLVYGTGGFAFGSTEFKDVLNKTDKNQAGYALGFGAEMKITSNISARAEYLHYGLGSESYRSVSGPISIDTTTNVIRGGVSYHF